MPAFSVLKSRPEEAASVCSVVESADTDVVCGEREQVKLSVVSGGLRPLPAAVTAGREAGAQDISLTHRRGEEGEESRPGSSTSLPHNTGVTQRRLRLRLSEREILRVESSVKILLSDDFQQRKY